ncbi:MAG: peroxiredoxin family protein [Acidobacteria bacterium]|nr:peroxiredoxin family protein [Acidobacteriota bacterium]
MQGYQSGIQKFTDANTKVFGISMDALPSNKAFAEKIGITAFPLLSDWNRDVTKAYGLFGEKSVYARRGTFVVDKDGKIQQIVLDNTAVDPTSTADFCSLMEKKLVVAPPKP